MGIPWESSHGMGRDRHKLLWDENGADKYVPWTTLDISVMMFRLKNQKFLDESSIFDRFCKKLEFRVSEESH